MPLSAGRAWVHAGHVFQVCPECAARPAPLPVRARTELPPRPRLRTVARGPARLLLLSFMGLALVTLVPNVAEPNAEGVRTVIGDDLALPLADDRNPMVAVNAPEPPRIHELSLADSGESMRWVHPLAGPGREMPLTASRSFGAPRNGTRKECGRGHCGIDLGHERGEVVHAAADGFVVRIVRARHKKGGNYIKLRHLADYSTYYMHLDRIHPYLRRNSLVQAGDPLGTVGRSGIQRSAPHLHFAVTRRGLPREQFVDPEPMLWEAHVLHEPASLP